MSTKKHSMKDFDNLKMMNHTQYQDPILESFLEKAREMEEAAGSPDVPEVKKKVPQLSQKEQLAQLKNDPFRFYTFTDFNRGLRTTLQRTSSSKKNCLKCSLAPDSDPTDAQKSTLERSKQQLPAIVPTHHRQLSQPQTYKPISSASNLSHTQAIQQHKLGPPVSTAHTT